MTRKTQITPKPSCLHGPGHGRGAKGELLISSRWEVCSWSLTVADPARLHAPYSMPPSSKLLSLISPLRPPALVAPTYACVRKRCVAQGPLCHVMCCEWKIWCVIVLSVVGWRCLIRMNHGFVQLWQLCLIFFLSVPFFLLGHQGTYSRNLCDAFPAGFAHPGYCVGGISAHWQWCSQYGVALW